jgi:hypothetical protein
MMDVAVRQLLGPRQRFQVEGPVWRGTAFRGGVRLNEDWQRGYYHISNAQFSTESLISDARELIERVRYEAYGKARHLPRLALSGSFTLNDRHLGVEHPAGAGLSADAEGWSGPVLAPGGWRGQPLWAYAFAVQGRAAPSPRGRNSVVE